MSYETLKARIESVHKPVARLAARAADYDNNLKTLTGDKQFLIVGRPKNWGNDKRARGRDSMPGGKFKQADLEKVMDEQDTHDYSDRQLLIAVGFEALLRRLGEEHGTAIVEAVQGKLVYVAKHLTKTGWESLAYAGELDRKVDVSLPKDADKIQWRNESDLDNEKNHYLPGNLQLIKKAQARLNKNLQKNKVI